jgi:hypothetical protein
MSINPYRRATWGMATFRRIDGDRRPRRPERDDRHRFPHDDMFNNDARAVIDAEFEIIGPERPRRGAAESANGPWEWIKSRLWGGS